jgi:hypothetical protein
MTVSIWRLPEVAGEDAVSVRQGSSIGLTVKEVLN